jgi:hypothetical protein
MLTAPPVVVRPTRKSVASLRGGASRVVFVHPEYGRITAPIIPTRLIVGGPMAEERHEQACLLGQERSDRMIAHARSFCHGRHGFGRPMMMLQAQQNLGPCRHALTQMVVAGGMVIQPPVQVRVPAPALNADRVGDATARPGPSSQEGSPDPFDDSFAERAPQSVGGLSDLRQPNASAADAARGIAGTPAAPRDPSASGG